METLDATLLMESIFNITQAPNVCRALEVDQFAVLSKHTTN